MKFSKVGSPDWEKCQAIRIFLDKFSGADLTAFLDVFNFKKARYGGTYHDAASQTEHGAKMGATIVKDSLTSHAECQLEAEGIINRHKDSKLSLQDLDVEADLDFVLADTILTSASSSRFRLRRNTIAIGPGGELSSIISLSEEPVEVTYTMKKLVERIRRLELGF